MVELIIRINLDADETIDTIGSADTDAIAGLLEQMAIQVQRGDREFVIVGAWERVRDHRRRSFFRHAKKGFTPWKRPFSKKRAYRAV